MRSERRPGGAPPPGRPRGGRPSQGPGRPSQGPGRTARGGDRPPRPDPGRPQHWFAEQLLLVLSAQRPVHSLLGRTRGPAYEQLARLADQAPLWPDREAGSRSPTLRQVGAFRPAEGVVEAFARISVGGGRLRAMAFRLEYQPNGQWACAAVELGPHQRQPAVVG